MGSKARTSWQILPKSLKIKEEVTDDDKRSVNDTAEEKEIEKTVENEGIEVKTEKKDAEETSDGNKGTEEISDENKEKDDLTDEIKGTEEITDENKESSTISPFIFQAIQSSNIEEQIQAITDVRKYLSTPKEPNWALIEKIEQVVKTGIVPVLVKLLRKKENNSQLLFEVMSVLANITVGTNEQTDKLMQALDTEDIKLYELLQSDVEDIQDLTLGTLENIALTSPEWRDYITGSDIIQYMLQLLTKAPRVSVITNSISLLAVLCEGKNPQPDFDEILKCLPLLSRLLFHTNNKILEKVCLILSFICDGYQDNIEYVIDAGICGRLVQLTMHAQYDVAMKAQLAVGVILTMGDTEQKQLLINCSLLHCLQNVLATCTNESMKKSICWMISNITSGDEKQIQSVIDANLFPLLIQILDTGDDSTRTEVIWAIIGATRGGTPDQIRYIVNQDCILPLSNLLTTADDNIKVIVLNSIENILRHGQRCNDDEYLTLIKNNCLEKIRDLQNQGDGPVSQSAYDIITLYFPSDEDDSS